MKIKINGNEYTREELEKFTNKQLHIETVIAISKIQEHIETQDKANEKRFNFHEKLIYGSIFGIVITSVLLVIKLFLG